MTREVRKRAPFDSTSAWNPFHFLSQMPLNDMKVTSSIIVSRHSGAQAAIEIAQETDGNNRLRRLPDLSCFITLTRSYAFSSMDTILRRRFSHSHSFEPA